MRDASLGDWAPCLAVTRVANSQPLFPRARLSANPVPGRLRTLAVTIRAACENLSDGGASCSGHYPRAAGHAGGAPQTLPSPTAAQGVESKPMPLVTTGWPARAPACVHVSRQATERTYPRLHHAPRCPSSSRLWSFADGGARKWLSSSACWHAHGRAPPRPHYKPHPLRPMRRVCVGQRVAFLAFAAARATAAGFLGLRPGPNVDGPAPALIHVLSEDHYVTPPPFGSTLPA